MKNSTKLEVDDQIKLMKVGKLLKEYRVDSYLSRQDVEDMYGVSRSTVERVENGNNLTLLTFFKLICAYDVSILDFIQNLEEEIYD